MAQNHPNLVRRGRVFHFRFAVPRRLRRLLRRSELTCSLRTSDARAAALLARRLYLSIQDLIDDIERDPMLSPEQIADLVRNFYHSILAHHDHNRLSQGPITEEMKAARAQQWTRVAEQARVSLGSNRFDHAMLYGWALRRSAGLLDCTVEEKRQINQALLRAGIDLAETLRARYEGDFDYQPKWEVLRQPPTVPPIGSSAVHERAQRSSPPAATFTNLAGQFVTKRTMIGTWENQTALQYAKTYEMFAEVRGDLPVDAYTRRDASEFKTLLELLPADYGKAAQYRGLALPDIRARVAEQKVERLSSRTVKRHLTALSTLWDDLIAAGTLKENIFKGFRFTNQKRAQDQRAMWSLSELSSLFMTPVWTGCKSRSKRSAPGELVIKDEKYWVPLIAIYSGARQEEICQLHIEDVREEEGIWVFDINSRAPRKLKNKTAIRLVPVHSALIAMGFLEYRKEREEARDARLFPNLSPGGADGRLGHAFAKWFTRYRKEVGLYQHGKDFHSLRHSATTFLHQGGVEAQIVDRLTGHVTPGETARYTKQSRIAQLKEAIETIPRVR